MIILMLDGEFLPRDYETSMGIAQLKSFLKRHVDNLGGGLEKVYEK